MTLPEEGIILVNKDKGKTSRDVVNELCPIFGTKRVGHTGTLDPIATGVLVVCIGKYTKLTNYLLSFKKKYKAVIKLGLKTDTLDITGKVLEKRTCKVSKEAVQKVLTSFIGKFEQEIPIYSAKKINGKKLYEYARNNEKVDIPHNEVEIYDINLISVNDDEITFDCTVSKGTYIRSLISEICKRLNGIGTMKELERTMQGDYDISSSYKVDDIKKGNYQILKAKDMFNYKTYIIDDTEYLKVKNGNQITLKSNEDKLILIYNNKEIAIYERKDNLYKPMVML